MPRDVAVEVTEEPTGRPPRAVVHTFCRPRPGRCICRSTADVRTVSECAPVGHGKSAAVRVPGDLPAIRPAARGHAGSRCVALGLATVQVAIRPSPPGEPPPGWFRDLISPPRSGDAGRWRGAFALIQHDLPPGVAAAITVTSSARCQQGFAAPCRRTRRSSGYHGQHRAQNRPCRTWIGSGTLLTAPGRRRCSGGRRGDLPRRGSSR